MNTTFSKPRRLWSGCLPCVFVGIALTLSLNLLSVAQSSTDSSMSAQPQSEKKTYVEQNGTQQLTSTLERESRSTSEGTVEIERYRAPAWAGDTRVTWEREVRTRKLPDGRIEREFVLRNPDGDG